MFCNQISMYVNERPNPNISMIVFIHLTLNEQNIYSDICVCSCLFIKKTEMFLFVCLLKKLYEHLINVNGHRHIQTNKIEQT